MLFEVGHPCVARSDWEQFRRQLPPGLIQDVIDRSEIKREVATVSFVYSFKRKVENDLIPVNPLGLTITYFREDTAFK